MTSILSPLNKLPIRQQSNILIVGDDGTGVQELGLSLLEQKFPFSVHVRTASALPLPKDDTRPRIDYICYIVNVTSEESLKVVRAAVQNVDVRYFVGRSCLLITGVEFHKHEIIDLEIVTQFAESHDLPFVFGEVQTELDLGCLASKILKMVEIASGMKGNLSSMLIDSTRRDFDHDL